MKSSYLKFNVSELVKYRDGINLRELEMKESLVELAVSKKEINKILSGIPNSDIKNGFVMLPKDLYEKVEMNSGCLKNNFNWKKVAMEVMQNAGGLVSTSDIYKKAKIKYPIELADKVKGIRGFSAALQYLLAKNKIIKIIKDKSHLYGLEGAM